jgi:hypothetical protein
MAARKLKLDLDALGVESFTPVSGPRERGTVMGNATEQSFYGTCTETCERTVCEYSCSPYCGPTYPGECSWPCTATIASSGCSVNESC